MALTTQAYTNFLIQDRGHQGVGFEKSIGGVHTSSPPVAATPSANKSPP